MEAFFASPRIADLVLAVLALEAVILLVIRARSGRAPRPRVFLPFLAAGAFLALALRAALSGAAWPWMAGALTGALVVHALDLGRRWPPAGPPSEES